MPEAQTLEELSIHAAKIERMADQACAKISEHANRCASRVLEANGEANASAAELEKFVGAAMRKAESQAAKIDAQTKELNSIKKSLASISEAVEDIEVRTTKARGFVHGVCDILGKPVQLKSGGHVMTAASLGDDGGILCFWFAGQVMQQQSIPLAALEPAGMNESQENKTA